MTVVKQVTRPLTIAAIFFSGVAGVNNFRRASVAVSVASLIALAAPTLAQAQIQQIPPLHYTVDANGVDLVTRQWHVVTSEVTIGQPGAGGLTYGRIALATDNSLSNQIGWRDLAIGGVSCGGSPLLCTVSIGSMSEDFQETGGGNFVSLAREGSTLYGPGGYFDYMSADGTRAYFEPLSGTNPYNADALLMTITSPNGEVTTYNYTAVSGSRRLQSITNNYGYQIHYRYDATVPTLVTKVLGFNMASAICDPFAPNCDSLGGSWPSVTYTRTPDTFGGVNETAVDQGLRTTLYHLDPSGELDGIQLDGQVGYQRSVQRDPANNRVYYADGPSGIWGYDDSDSGTVRTVIATGPSGQVTTVITDLTEGQPSEVRQLLDPAVPKEIIRKFDYDAYGRLEEIENPEGDKTNYLYDIYGNITSTTVTAKGGGATFTSSAVYDLCSNAVTCDSPSSTTDRFNRTTNYEWDTTHGGLLKVQLPAPSPGTDRPETRYTYAPLNAYFYSPSGSIVPGGPITLLTEVSACPSGVGASCVGGPSERRSTINYPSAGGLTNLLPYSTTARSGDGSIIATTTMSYTPSGDVASVTGPLGGSTMVEYLYDGNRQVTGIIGPDPDGGGPLLNRAQRLTYNSRGLVELTEAGTTTGYGSGLPGFTTMQRQAATYDSYGRPLTARQQAAGGNDFTLQQVSYDASGRTDCVTLRMNPATFGDLPLSPACTLTALSAFGPDRIVKTVYDRLNRPVSTISGFGSSPITESITYTDNGQPATLTDGANNVSGMAYDGFDRPTRLCYPVLTTTCALMTSNFDTYGYDDTKNRTTYTNRASQVFTTQYDGLQRPVAVTNTGGAPGTYYAYDNFGQVTKLSNVPLTSPAFYTYGYDALGRQTSEGGPFGALLSAYDLAGYRIQLKWPDGAYADYGYYPTGELGGINLTVAPTTVSVWGQGYDDLGRPVATYRGNGANSVYSYDAISRLTSITHDPANTSADVTYTFTHNPAGQIISRTVSNSGYLYSLPTATTGYTNDAMNRVTSVGGAGVGYDANSNLTTGFGQTYGYDAKNQLTTAGSTAGFVYDPAGRLFTESNTAGPSYSAFLYDGAQLVAEYDGSGNVFRRHIPGAGLDATVATYDGSGLGSPSWLLSDERRSVVALTDGSGGATQINRYDEYGVPQSGNGGRFQYTGQMYLADAGLYHYRARAYAPQLGRFLQTDPTGYGAGMNLYAYVDADPINMRDPLGLAGCGRRSRSRLPMSQDECDRLKAMNGAALADAENAYSALMDYVNAGVGGAQTESGRRFANQMLLAFGRQGLTYNQIERMRSYLTRLIAYLRDPGTPSSNAYINTHDNSYRLDGGTIDRDDDRISVNFETVFPNTTVQSLFSRLILPHEFGHLRGPGYGDSAYGSVDIRRLAISDPRRAIANGDSYACVVTFSC